MNFQNTGDIEMSVYLSLTVNSSIGSIDIVSLYCTTDIILYL